jgi:hypothetical protein
VSQDGKWVLATSQCYLLVVPTFLEGEAKSGFEKSLGKSKPTPTKLSISIKDMVRFGI